MRTTRTIWQTGGSVLGKLITVVLLLFFLLAASRLAPAYLDSRAVRTALENVVASSDSSMRLDEVREKIRRQFASDHVEALDDSSVRVYRYRGSILIEANHEVRVQLFDHVDVVLKFEEFNFTVQ